MLQEKAKNVISALAKSAAHSHMQQSPTIRVDFVHVALPSREPRSYRLYVSATYSFYDCFRDHSATAATRTDDRLLSLLLNLQGSQGWGVSATRPTTDESRRGPMEE